MNILVIVQARIGSTRLPNKVLLPLAGRPLLERMIQRVTAATTPFELVVAITTDPLDDPIKELCRTLSVHCYAGDPTDLLDRHYKAATVHHADVVVKIPSDCPLIDPAVIDRVLNWYIDHRNQYDYVSNLHPATYPDGNDIEVIPMPVLEQAWRRAEKSFEREHTTPYIWERPSEFRLGNVQWETGRNYSMTHRWTIDYYDDYLFTKAVYDELWSATRKVFSLNDILKLLESRPDIQAINSRYAGVNWYRHHLGELKTVTQDQTRQETSNVPETITKPRPIPSKSLNDRKPPIRA